MGVHRFQVVHTSFSGRSYIVFTSFIGRFEHLNSLSLGSKKALQRGSKRPVKDLKAPYEGAQNALRTLQKCPVNNQKCVKIR